MAEKPLVLISSEALKLRTQNPLVHGKGMTCRTRHAASTLWSISFQTLFSSVILKSMGQASESRRSSGLVFF